MGMNRIFDRIEMKCWFGSAPHFIQLIEFNLSVDYNIKDFQLLLEKWLAKGFRLRPWSPNVYLVVAGGVSAVVDQQMVVAVELELIETEHEPLQDGFRLESDQTI